MAGSVVVTDGIDRESVNRFLERIILDRNKEWITCNVSKDRYIQLGKFTVGLLRESYDNNLPPETVINRIRDFAETPDEYTLLLLMFIIYSNIVDFGVYVKTMGGKDWIVGDEDVHEH